MAKIIDKSIPYCLLSILGVKWLIVELVLEYTLVLLIKQAIIGRVVISWSILFDYRRIRSNLGVYIHVYPKCIFISVNMYITVLIKIIVYGNGTANTILKMDIVIQ